MDLEILKKKISTYRGEGGRLTKVNDEVLMEILLAWEQWTGPAKGFYTAIGVNNHRKMASILGKAKKLRREGFPTDGFKELKVVDGGAVAASSNGPCGGIELQYKESQIRFSEVDLLLEFLKKAA